MKTGMTTVSNEIDKNALIAEQETLMKRIAEINLLLASIDKNVTSELKIRASDMLERIDRELIGNGGNSRLAIMLDTETMEVWTDEFCDNEQNSWHEYNDDAVICVGNATNSLYPDEDEENYDPEDEGFAWHVVIRCKSDDQHFGGSSWDTSCDIDEILDAIAREYFPNARRGTTNDSK